MADAIFRSGGLASGLDTSTMIEQLTALEAQPITALRTRQTAMNTQISTLGKLASRLSDLDAATAALGTGGVVPISVQGANTAFKATAGTSASAGSFDLKV